MSSYSDSIAMRYPAPRQRSLSSLRTPSLLPDISENSPSRTPSPPQALQQQTHVRSVSVASFLSDGTIEIEGFGFDNNSEIGDDSSIYGGESMYADSVFDGHDNDNEGGGIARPHTPSDLSWRAERILANAKKKLDLCGQNISRARSSLILSPSTTPTSFHEQLDGMKAMPALHSHRFRLGNSSVTGNSNSSYGNSNINSHLRTNSESSVPYQRKGVNGPRSPSRAGGDGLGTIEDVDEHPAEIERPQSEQSTTPSKSTQQMRALRDQMKDLRGKITSLQNQAKTDSMRRRSVTSIRTTTPGPYDTQSTSSLDDLKVEDLSPIEPGEIWENAEEIPDDYSSTRSGTPRAFRRSASPFEARHEDREDAFSYDALFYGNGIYAASNSNGTNRPMSYSSDGTASTATVLEPPRITAVRAAMRRDSFGSIESFATAAEDRSSSASSMQRPIDPTPPLAVPGEWLTPTMFSPRDDGYHSAPHTPQAPYHKNSSSSLSSETTKVNYPPTKSTPPLTHAPTATAYYPPTKSAMSAYIHESDTSIDARLTRSQSPRNLHRKSGISIGNTHITTTNNPNSGSSNALLLTTADGLGDISLRLGQGDRELIEQMIEGLGAVCCSMEMEQDKRRRAGLRRRLEGALAVLRGDATVGMQREVGGRRRVGGQQGLGIRENDMGESEDECF